MSFFGNIRKVLLIEINEKSHKFYALKSSDLIAFSKIQRAIEIETTDESLVNLVKILISYYADDNKPSIDDMLSLDVATLRHISQELVLASTPVDYVETKSE